MRQVKGPGHMIYGEMLWVMESFHVAKRRLRGGGEESNCRLKLFEEELQRQWNQALGSSRW